MTTEESTGARGGVPDFAVTGNERQVDDMRQHAEPGYASIASRNFPRIFFSSRDM